MSIAAETEARTVEGSPVAQSDSLISEARLALRRDYQRDGAVKLTQLFDADMLRKCREIFDIVVANPGPFTMNVVVGQDKNPLFNDNCCMAADPMCRELVSHPKIADLLADVWGSEHVWYYDAEYFRKEDGAVSGSEWHQDTTYQPWAGPHYANLWVPFEPLPKANSLEVVRGSHLWPDYDGYDFYDNKSAERTAGGSRNVSNEASSIPTMVTSPGFHFSSSLLPVPDIEAERRADPNSWDVVSYAMEPGDVFMFHPHCFHGGAPVDANCPNRHAIAFRFYGDDAKFRPHPADSKADFPPEGIYFREQMAHLKAGDLFRSPFFLQLR